MHAIARWGLVAALCLVPAGAGAQSALGLKAGTRLADIRDAETADGTSRFILGAYFGTGLTDRTALQFEVTYGGRGADGLRIGKDGLDPAAPMSDLATKHIDIPILLRTAFPSRRVLASLFVGPYVSLLTDCELTVAGEARDCGADADQRFHPRATDYGILAGGGLDLVIGEGTVFIDLRYSQGLLSIQSGDDGMDARHTGLEIAAGFAFPLGR